MLTGRGTGPDGNQVVILGLSRANVEKLTAGQPIRVCRQTHGEAIPAGWEIVILFGETEQSLFDDLKDIGALAATEIKRLPPGAE